MPALTAAADAARPHDVPRADPRRVLVVAHRTATSPQLIEALLQCRDHGPVSFRLVVPALNSRLRHWLSDIDDAVAAARQQGEGAVAELRSHGLSVAMDVGDSVPLLAIEDALAQFAADEIVIATPPAGRDHWLEHDLVSTARRRFHLPIRHVVAGEPPAPAAPAAPARAALAA
jgi:hypothetical protein